jgi:hypothetical protein
MVQMWKEMMPSLGIKRENCKFVCVTASGDYHSDEFDDVLHKPLNLKELKASVDSF